MSNFSQRQIACADKAYWWCLPVWQDKVSFEANLKMAKRAGLNLSSQLLRLATEAYR